MNALIVARRDFDADAAERMRPYVDAFRNVIDKVAEAEVIRISARKNAQSSEVARSLHAA
jgi:hypothetical protein